MPTPGSNRYDIQRTRLRAELDDNGVPDQHADHLANELLQARPSGPSPVENTERAKGPLGERGGGGDPGNVFELRSPSFSDHAPMPPRHSRDGDDASPALEWEDPPGGAVELALMCEDPDAPGGPFLHWLVTGIDVSCRRIDEGAAPEGERLRVWPNGFGEEGWAGPQPPPGDEAHRYTFRVFALREPFEGEPDTDVEALRDRLQDASLATGTLVGLFMR